MIHTCACRKYQIYNMYCTRGDERNSILKRENCLFIYFLVLILGVRWWKKWKMRKQLICRYICWLRNVSLVRTMNRFKCARKNSKDSTFSDQMSSLVCYHPVIYSDQTWLETLDLQTVVHLWQTVPNRERFGTVLIKHDICYHKKDLGPYWPTGW